MASTPNLETNETVGTLIAETGSQTLKAEDKALFQSMSRALERVAGTHSRSGGRGSITKRLQLNGVELFSGVIRVSPTGAQPEQVNWDYFKTAFHSKYVGASYVEAR
ncbi:1-phosphatidylinositol-4,5-bisphosphate phosphodiesterase beta-2 [Gossypium australe]|uniref:1-phosphatidylinositol-4,5-bisphosphate phosphodiesterase beta-2 n=1 Tax=Gossypium australe TaxID=47621 RepID=A0A5B6UX43_9ROSI|nr:1-phosphatidylinositol-4,5-bisphosphate phosphodiesterase beta-2 [Gossypium australe]